MNFEGFLSPGFIWNVALSIVTLTLWLRKPGEDAGKKIAELQTRQDVMDERMKHVPTVTDLNELENRLGALLARMEGMVDKVSSTSNAVQRIEDFLRQSR
jgi:hypothetical protein